MFGNAKTCEHTKKNLTEKVIGAKYCHLTELLSPRLKVARWQVALLTVFLKKYQIMHWKFGAVKLLGRERIRCSTNAAR
jgi:hypothetical protein